jgi:hypothetical protein
MMHRFETDFKTGFTATTAPPLQHGARSSTLDPASFEAKRSREIVRERQDEQYATEAELAIREGRPVPVPNSWSEVSELAQRYPVVSITTDALVAVAYGGLPRVRATRNGKPLRIRRASARVRELWRNLALEILSAVDELHPDEACDLLLPVTAAIARAAGWSESDLGWESHRAIGDAMRGEREEVRA